MLNKTELSLEAHAEELRLKYREEAIKACKSIC